MKDYVIITLSLNKRTIPERCMMDMCDDIYYERCDKIEAYYRERGAEVFFRQTKNTTVWSREFATVEHSIDLSDRQKQTLTSMLKLFFAGGESDAEGVNERSELFAVIFKKTDGNMIYA